MRRPNFTYWLNLMWTHKVNRRDFPRQWQRFLLQCIKHHKDPRVRHRCLCFADCGKNPKLLSALISLAANQSEDPVLRGQALEGIPGFWLADCFAGRRRRRARRTILECLRDSDANVRFWACYAVAETCMYEATPILLTMLQDEGLSIMGWTVAYEAGEALKCLQGQGGWEDNGPTRREVPYPSYWRGPCPTI